MRIMLLNVFLWLCDLGFKNLLRENVFVKKKIILGSC